MSRKVTLMLAREGFTCLVASEKSVRHKASAWNTMLRIF